MDIRSTQDFKKTKESFHKNKTSRKSQQNQRKQQNLFTILQQLQRDQKLQFPRSKICPQHNQSSTKNSNNKITVHKRADQSTTILLLEKKSKT